MNNEDFPEEFEQRVTDIVAAKMRLVRVERVDKCSFDECHTPATHFSTFDGVELCAAHADAYIVKMRAFFDTQARKQVFRAFQFQKSMEDADRPTEVAEHDEPELQREETASPDREGDVESGGSELSFDAQVSVGLGLGSFDA